MEGLLPVGSIVVLEKAPDILYMIAGYYPAAGAEVRDYAAVRYPAGLGDTMKLELFDADQIRAVGSGGYTDEDSERMLRRIPEFMQTTGELITGAAQLERQVRSLAGENADDMEENHPISIEME